MIKDKKLELVKSEGDINYYLFTPSLFSLYYNESSDNHKEEPAHRNSISHKLHMLWYVLNGGYKILYAEKNNEILSYIIFTKANNKIIKNCDKDDYYTIFLWTYPQFRGQGLATLMSKTMLDDLNIKYNTFYKTINKDNYASIKVAEKCGFTIKCVSVKTGLLHTINFTDNGTQFLYYKKSDDLQL